MGLVPHKYLVQTIRKIANILRKILAMLLNLQNVLSDNHLIVQRILCGAAAVSSADCDFSERLRSHGPGVVTLHG